jgi:hypothetical protein
MEIQGWGGSIYSFLLGMVRQSQVPFFKGNNMDVGRIAAYNNEIYQRTQTKKLDQVHEERRLEERRNKQLAEVNEQKRIEQNRQMNRPGQNVDRMA